MEKVYIIAEAGVNHNGSVTIAKKMIDQAAEAGADAIKFQTFKAERLTCKTAPKAAYQKKTTGNDGSQQEMLKKLELSDDDFKLLYDHANDKKIEFLSSPFDPESLRFLLDLGMDKIKIPSGEITNYPLLRDAGRSGKKVILSTGMSTLDEIQDAVHVLKENGSKRIALLHCNTEYPTPYADVNLRAMRLLADTFGVEIGYSDHTEGMEVAIAAAACGASIIEKHFTLDRNMEGPDHRASLEPAELKQLVQSVRNVENALGKYEKKPTMSESGNRSIARKSLVAGCRIKKGELFSEENLTAKRPGNGISPMRWQEIIGKAAPRDFDEDEMIDL